jgi:hypothetical protein
MKGKPAKGPTAEEFACFMKLLFSNGDLLLRSEPGIRRWTRLTGGDPSLTQPMFSFDNDSIQSQATTLTRLGMFDFLTRLPLPAHSPDLHRTVERPHARICRPFQEWVNGLEEHLSPAQYIDKLRTIFYTTQLSDIIIRDMKDIRQLYTRVVQLRGGRPEKKYR